MRIAVDAMGGDNAPREIVKGAVDAAKEFGIEVVLVGNEPQILEVFQQYRIKETPALEIVHTSEVINMDEHPAGAVRKKKNSSIVRAVELVKEKRADAVLSAGNTGAVMAASIFLLGRVEGIYRPALASILPNQQGATLLLDVGANVDCKPKHLLQFAVMGHLYAKKILGVSNPRVGLLSIGEEDCKGNELTLAVLPMLQRLNFNFIGNVEGRNIFDGNADVVVCDGFVGNVILKAGEGLAKALIGLMHSEVKKSSLAMMGTLLAYKSLKSLQKRLDYTEYGGAPLLGVNGVSVVCHGNSNSYAVKNAVRMACESVSKNLVSAIRDNTINSLQKGVLRADV